MKISGWKMTTSGGWVRTLTLEGFKAFEYCNGARNEYRVQMNRGDSPADPTKNYSVSPIYRHDHEAKRWFTAMVSEAVK